MKILQEDEKGQLRFVALEELPKDVKKVHLCICDDIVSPTTANVRQSNCMMEIRVYLGDPNTPIGLRNKVFIENMTWDEDSQEIECISVLDAICNHYQAYHVDVDASTVCLLPTARSVVHFIVRQQFQPMGDNKNLWRHWRANNKWLLPQPCMTEADVRAHDTFRTIRALFQDADGQCTSSTAPASSSYVSSCKRIKARKEKE